MEKIYTKDDTVTAFGMVMPVREWADIEGIPLSKLLQDLNNGMPPEEALSKGTAAPKVTAGKEYTAGEKKAKTAKTAVGGDVLKPWRDLSDIEIGEIKEEKCRHCQYAGHISFLGQIQKGAKHGTMCCDYSSKMGVARGGDPRTCQHYLDEKRQTISEKTRRSWASGG